MAEFPRLPVFVAVNIEPLSVARIIGQFLRLPPPAQRRSKELTERIVRDYAINPIRLEIGLEAEGEDLAIAGLNANTARLRAMFE
jgi:hypothetical protein